MIHPKHVFVTASLLLCTLLFKPAEVIAADIEIRDGKPVIHVIADGLPDPRATDIDARANLAIVQLFEKKFLQIFRDKYLSKYKSDLDRYGHFDWDHVAVEVSPFQSLNVQGVETDLLAIAGDRAPDILYVNCRKSDNYIRSGFLYPLDKPQDGYLSGVSDEDLKDRVPAAFWDVIRREGADGQKHVWMMPYGGALAKVLWYRKDMFDAAGVAYPNPDWTWTDMMAAARKLTDPSRGTYGILLDSGPAEAFLWFNFLWCAGGEPMVFDKNTGAWRCTIDSPQAAAALDFYTRLVGERWTDAKGQLHRGYAYRDSSDITAKWNEGKIGMRFTYADERMIALVNPQLVGIAPVPKGPEGYRAAELNCQMFGLFSGIKQPAVRDAAWEFIKFYDSPEAQTLHTRIMVESGFGQFLNPIALRKAGYRDIERLSPPGWSKTFEIAIATGKPEPYGRNSNFAYPLMTLPISRANELMLQDKLPTSAADRLTVLRQLLKEGNDRANEVMIGIITPAERARRRIIASLVLVAIVASFAYVLFNVRKIFSGQPNADASSRSKRPALWAYLLLAPAVLTIVIWQYVPLGMGSLMAFQDYKLLGRSEWAGLDNFGNTLVDGYWWSSLWNSTRYSLLVISLTFVPPILLAILLQEIPHGKIVFRTVFYLPAVITGIVVTLLWKQFYDPSNVGILNAIVLRLPIGLFLLVGIGLGLGAAMFARRLRYHEMKAAAVLCAAAGFVVAASCLLFVLPIVWPENEGALQALRAAPWRLLHGMPEPMNWLNDPSTSMLACVVPMVWAGIGPGCLIYLAALKGIPDDYYEAAELDGANFIDKIVFVVIPMLRPLIVIQFVGAFIGSFYGASGNILAMTGGAANTEVADLHIWYRAFTYLDFGSATAMAWMLGFLLIGFTVYQLRILARVEFRATGAAK